MAVQTERDTGPPASGRLIPRTRPGERIAAIALVVAALAIAAQFAWQQHHSPAPIPAPAPASAAASVPIGAVDAPSSEAIVGTAVHIFGWALDPTGIRDVEIRVDGRRYVARYGIPRPDVARVKTGYPDSAASGFAFDGDFAPLTPQRHELTVVAVNRAATATVLARKGLVPPSALEQWRELYLQRYGGGSTPVFLNFAPFAVRRRDAAPARTGPYPH